MQTFEAAKFSWLYNESSPHLEEDPSFFIYSNLHALCNY